MKWEKFKKKVKDHVDTVYNKGKPTETLIFKNGRGISKYDGVSKQKDIIKLLENSK